MPEELENIDGLKTPKINGILDAFNAQNTPKTNTNLDIENPYELGDLLMILLLDLNKNIHQVILIILLMKV